jgi:predicted nucleotidyltransferase
MNAVRPLPNLPPYRFVEHLAQFPFVESIVLYGSRARGDERERSDIDIAISAPAADRNDWQRVLDLVEDADTLLEIDCVRLDDLAPGDRLRRSIETEGVVLYQRSPP